MMDATMSIAESKTVVDFGIQIDFDRDSRDPARIFRAMSNLIYSFQQLDYALVGSIDVSIEPILMLENVEAGSLRTWLRESVLSVEDGSLRSGDWKKIVGQYLVRGKYILLRFLENKKTLSSRDDLLRLQHELVSAAEETQVRGIPIYSPVPMPKLLGGIKSVNEALSELGNLDKAKFISSDGDVAMNPILAFSLSEMEELLTREVITNESTLILKVKKPDYLGESKWEFVFEHAIDAKILDSDWLSRFQRREVDVRPGDALRALVQTQIRYGYDGDVIGISYTVLQVIEVIPFSQPQQPRLHE
jgi:hypothetical protein